MSIIYLDTSALVKNYIAEAGSAWVNTLLVSEDISTTFTSHLTVVEATCALARRRREGSLSPGDHIRLLASLDYDFAHRYNVIDVTPTVIDAARLLRTGIHFEHTMQYNWQLPGWHIRNVHVQYSRP